MSVGMGLGWLNVRSTSASFGAPPVRLREPQSGVAASCRCAGLHGAAMQHRPPCYDETLPGLAATAARLRLRLVLGAARHGFDRCAKQPFDRDRMPCRSR